MRKFRDLPVKWKLTLIIMVASTTPLLLCCAAFIGYEVFTFRGGMVRELSSQAEIIGSNNLGNLRFQSLGIDTKEDAEQTLQSLRANKHIVSAGIYAQQGKLFAAYARSGVPDDFSPRLSGDHYFEDNHLILFKPIIQDQDSLGTVYIKSDLAEMNARLQQYAGIVGMFMLGSFLIAFVLASVLQRVISRPILGLADTTKIVSEKKDYSIRAVKESNDEVGQLIDGFNEMLSQIQERDHELRAKTDDLRVSKEQLEDYSQNLEQKVSFRTQELKGQNRKLEKALQQLKEMQNQIVLQQKLASLGKLTAGIAHEIKNPLNFVNNFAELSISLTQDLHDSIGAERNKFAPDAWEEIDEIVGDLQTNVKKINAHGRRADSIVRNMLLHSRGKPGEYQDTDINTLLDEYVNLAYHGMRAKDASFNITIAKDYDESLQPIAVVPQEISRVFLNIVSNACYATHEKAKQRESDSFSPTLSIATKDLGEMVEIRIRDNGSGIGKENVDKIFNPFFSTKPSGEGTGLGLSISYEIVVQQHKGTIEVETEKGSHTEFIIKLPKKQSVRTAAVE